MNTRFRNIILTLLAAISAVGCEQIATTIYGPFGRSLSSVETPTFSPAAGTYSSAQSVSVSSATSGALIYYTIDGSTPTSSSAVYGSAIPVSATTTIKTLAVKAGMGDSTVASATYTITAASAIPRNGLLAEYLFDGNSNDSAGAHNGTANNIAATTDRFGNTNKAYYFNGTSSVVIPSASDLKQSFPLSYSVWIRQDSSLAYDSPLIMNDNYSSAYSGARLYLFMTGQIDAEYCDGLGQNSNNRKDYITNASVITLGTWHHVCLVFYSSTSVTIYIDGALASTYIDGSGTSLGYASGDFSIGQYFKGGIDELRYYNRALTSSEISALYSVNS
jgi:hypothetical protein